MEDNYKEVKKEEPCLKLIHMDQVEVEEIEWLFYPFIPYGKVTIIQGDPGEGKTTVVLQIIAKLTKGEAILSETSEGKSEEAGVEPINVIYQTAEDGLGDTIKPRLLAAGADCSRVLVIDDQDQPLTMVDARLEEAIIQTKARLVVLDPIQGFLGAGVDMHRANEQEKAEEKTNILNALNFARKVIATQECDFLLLDEILALPDYGITTAEAIGDILKMKDESMHILLTGRTLPDSLRKYADSITTLTTEIV